MNRSYCVCYYFPNRNDYYHKDNNKPLSKEDWVYTFVRWPTRDEMLNSFVKLNGNEIIYVLNIENYSDNESYIITFMTKDLKKRYLITSKDYEIIDPVTLTSYCKLVELDEVVNERIND